MSLRNLGFGLALCVASGCSSTPAEADGELTALRATPTTLDVGGQSIRATAEIWRDMRRAVGSPLTVTIQFPRGTPAVTVTQVWVLLGRDSWSGTVSQVNGSNTWVAGNGPEWPVGSQVDVVAQIRLVGSGAGRVRVAGVSIQGQY